MGCTSIALASSTTRDRNATRRPTSVCHARSRRWRKCSRPRATRGPECVSYPLPFFGQSPPGPAALKHCWPVSPAYRSVRLAAAFVCGPYLQGERFDLPDDLRHKPLDDLSIEELTIVFRCGLSEALRSRSHYTELVPDKGLRDTATLAHAPQTLLAGGQMARESPDWRVCSLLQRVAASR